MPLYDYACGSCGRFSAARPLKEFDQPAPCPGCGVAAPRALSVPVLLGSAARRQPAAATSSDDGRYSRLRHSAGCGCCGP